MYVSSIILTETGTYNDMFNHPYETNVKVDQLLELQKVTDFGASATQNNVAEIASMMIRPSAKPTGAVDIVNGWGNTKLRFMAEVEHGGVGGMKTKQILTGYTDHPGYDAHGNIDPNMLLYINNTITIREITRIDAAGHPRISTSVSDSSQVLNGTWDVAGAAAGVNPCYMLPQDIFDGITLEQQMGGLGTANGRTVIDVRNTGIEGASKSRRNNNNPAQYMSRILKSYQESFVAADATVDNMDTILRNARKNVAELPIEKDLALATLGYETEFKANQCIRWGELKRFRPDLDNIAVIARHSAASGVPLSVRGQFQNWNGTDNETVAATIIANTLPSIMSDLICTKVHFTATNEVTGGMDPFHIQVDEMRSFSGAVSRQAQFMGFRSRVLHELLMPISHGNRMSVNVGITADFLGDITISISINGGPTTPYSFPTWCDALLPPVLTLSQENRLNISRDFNKIITNLDTRHYLSGTPTVPGPQNQSPIIATPFTQPAQPTRPAGGAFSVTAPAVAPPTPGQVNIFGTGPKGAVKSLF